jgi:hypothetical protein
MFQLRFSFIFLNPVELIISLVGTSIFLLANYFIIKSASYQEVIGINKSTLFRTAAYINIIVSIVIYFIPTAIFSGNTNSPEFLIYSIYTITGTVIRSSIGLITFGILFYIIGVRNQGHFGNYLRLSAIFRFISEPLTILSSSLFYFFETGLIPDILTFGIIASILSIIIAILRLISIILLIVYAYKNNDDSLIYAGIVLIILIFYSFISSFLLVLLYALFPQPPMS